jgi:hypothetical protein
MIRCHTTNGGAATRPRVRSAALKLYGVRSKDFNRSLIARRTCTSNTPTAGGACTSFQTHRGTSCQCRERYRHTNRQRRCNGLCSATAVIHSRRYYRKYRSQRNNGNYSFEHDYAQRPLLGDWRKYIEVREHSRRNCNRRNEAARYREKMSGAFTLIKTAVFAGVTDVRFYDETLGHIREHHPEVPILLPAIYASVSQCIVNPTYIEASYKNSFVFVDAESTDASGGPLRIPVRIVEGTSGRVTSAYFAHVTGSPNIVWRRP